MSPKISTSDAARSLRDHPANVVRSVSEMVSSLDDCWPELDDGFVETLRVLHRDQHSEPTDERTDRDESSIAATPKLPRSPAGLKILDKLERKDKWGGNHVGWDTLRNHYCRGVRDLDDAVDELVEEELLLSGESRHGPYSLNPARKGEIESLLTAYRLRGM